MTISCDIRAAREEDAEKLFEMVVALACDTGKKFMVSGTAEDIRRHAFGPTPLIFALIAWDERTAAGMAICFNEFSTWRGRRGVYLQDLYVAPKYRGSGVGRALVNAVSSRAENTGAAYIRLAVDAGNQKAAAFYRELGFEEHREDVLYVLEGARIEAEPSQ